jgi:hypothetical protein
MRRGAGQQRLQIGEVVAPCADRVLPAHVLVAAPDRAFNA